jgi:hypothetical protein
MTPEELAHAFMDGLDSRWEMHVVDGPHDMGPNKTVVYFSDETRTNRLRVQITAE